jgi:hypothetical protein
MTADRKSSAVNLSVQSSRDGTFNESKAPTGQRGAIRTASERVGEFL